jgi:bifunctional DNA-binding transcriptional regulator/antitoxin component of YhaV-PrlF toxin-antitoxin module
LKGGWVTTPKRIREKLRVNDRDFLTYLKTRNGPVKIKKLEFDWNDAVKKTGKLKRQKLLQS